ncbi:MAG: hypothetical protein H7Y36_08705, partial [Armatimonadetes bacterium]|nr:hypothetical protein [Akkermansiaceae bacterium]
MKNKKFQRNLTGPAPRQEKDVSWLRHAQKIRSGSKTESGKIRSGQGKNWEDRQPVEKPRQAFPIIGMLLVMALLITVIGGAVWLFRSPRNETVLPSAAVVLPSEHKAETQ